MMKRIELIWAKGKQSLILSKRCKDGEVEAASKVLMKRAMELGYTFPPTRIKETYIS